jgi:hypothetical protein
MMCSLRHFEPVYIYTLEKNDKFCNTNKSGDKNQVVYRENDYCTTCQFKDVMRLFVEDLANIILTKLLAGFLNIFSETTRSIRTKLCKNDVCEIFYKKPHYVFELACSTVVIFSVYNLVLVFVQSRFFFCRWTSVKQKEELPMIFARTSNKECLWWNECIFLHVAMMTTSPLYH